MRNFKLNLLSGTIHRDLAEQIAVKMGTNLAEVVIKKFPDGEIFIKIAENIRGSDVFIIQPICISPNEALMELLIMIDAASRASAERITAVLPYYGYARQDRKDQPRVPITAKLVANLLVAAGCQRLLTIDLHAQQIQGFFDIPVDHLYAAPDLVKYLRAKVRDSLVVVSPDPGGLKMAYRYSTMLGAGLAIVAKQRKSASEVEALNVVGDVKGCNALIVDDLTSTAGTLCAAARLLKEHGAHSIRAAVTHSLLAEMGIARLKESPIEELVTTNSVPSKDWKDFPVTVLSMADLLGQAILRIHEDQSVSSLFQV